MAPAKRLLNSILITGGDPAGIGPELVRSLTGEIRNSNQAVTYLHTSSDSDLELLHNACSGAGLPFQVFTSLPESPPDDVAGFSIVRIEGGACPVPGSPNEAGGERAFQALRTACDLLEKHRYKGLLTAPLSKEWVYRSHSDFRGHTDYLAERFGCEVLMLMHGERLSVIPMTIHVPIHSVPGELWKALDSGRYDRLLARLEEMDVFRNTRWAVCGLNPHCGDGGAIGTEEIEYLDDTVERWRKAGLPVDGPLAADSLFIEDNLKKYRLVLACYHDQGLIPFKSLEGMNGINMTIGLPFLRTSPDHGTAYSIAGRGTTDPRSMQRAFRALAESEHPEGE